MFQYLAKAFLFNVVEQQTLLNVIYDPADDSRRLSWPRLDHKCMMHFWYESGWWYSSMRTSGHNAEYAVLLDSHYCQLLSEFATDYELYVIHLPVILCRCCYFCRKIWQKKNSLFSKLLSYQQNTLKWSLNFGFLMKSWSKYFHIVICRHYIVWCKFVTALSSVPMFNQCGM